MKTSIKCHSQLENSRSQFNSRSSSVSRVILVRHLWKCNEVSMKPNPAFSAVCTAVCMASRKWQGMQCCYARYQVKGGHGRRASSLKESDMKGFPFKRCVFIARRVGREFFRKCRLCASYTKSLPKWKFQYAISRRKGNKGLGSHIDIIVLHVLILVSLHCIFLDMPRLKVLSEYI